MAISLNALFNIPTRDEKEKKRAQGQAAVDRISEMQLADELAKGQMRYAKELGIEFDDKAAQAETARIIDNLRKAGDPTPEETAAKGKSAGVMGEVAKFVGSAFGIGDKVPQRKAAAEGAKADEETATSRNKTAREAGAARYQGLLGETGAQREASRNVLDTSLNETMYSLGDKSAEALSAELTQRRQAAEDYAAQGALRDARNATGLLELQQRQNYLKQIANDPMRLELMENPKINPLHYGFGVQPGMPMVPLAPMGQPQPQTGLLGGGMRPQDSESKRARMMRALDDLVNRNSVNTD